MENHTNAQTNAQTNAMGNGQHGPSTSTLQAGMEKKAGEAIEKLGQKVTSVGHVGENAVEEWASAVAKKAGEFQDKVEQTIKARPIAVLLGALAVGYLANHFLLSKPPAKKAENA